MRCRPGGTEERFQRGSERWDRNWPSRGRPGLSSRTPRRTTVSCALQPSQVAAPDDRNPGLAMFLWRIDQRPLRADCNSSALRPTTTYSARSATSASCRKQSADWPFSGSDGARTGPRPSSACRSGSLRLTKRSFWKTDIFLLSSPGRVYSSENGSTVAGADDPN